MAFFGNDLSPVNPNPGKIDDALDYFHNWTTKYDVGGIVTLAAWQIGGYPDTLKDTLPNK